MTSDEAGVLGNVGSQGSIDSIVLSAVGRDPVSGKNVRYLICFQRYPAVENIVKRRSALLRS